MRIDVSGWQEFTLEKLFKVRQGRKCTPEAVRSHGHGRYNYISTSSANNGVAGRYNFWNEKGNVITVESACRGYAAYQETEFSASHHVEILDPLFDLDKDVALFLVTLINRENYRFNYGHKPSKRIIRKMKLLLPVKRDASGNFLIDEKRKYSDSGYVPDWNYMGKYIAELRQSAGIGFTGKNKQDMGLETEKWKYFKIGELFTIKNGRELYDREIKAHKGKLEVVQGSAADNGVAGMVDVQYCTSKGYLVCLNECLTVARTGNTGYVSFHENGCAVGGSAKLLLLPDGVADRYVYLFVQCVLNFNRHKYSFGRKLNKQTFNHAKIMLPAVYVKMEQGKMSEESFESEVDFVPDWHFMRKYIKNLLGED